MLPGMEGWEICRELRRVSEVPLLMLVGREEEIDRVIGLAQGRTTRWPSSSARGSGWSGTRNDLSRYDPRHGVYRLSITEGSVSNTLRRLV